MGISWYFIPYETTVSWKGVLQNWRGCRGRLRGGFPEVLTRGVPEGLGEGEGHGILL